MKFVSIGAMFSELVAVSSKGELYQWKWNEPEPYRNAQVENLINGITKKQDYMYFILKYMYLYLIVALLMAFEHYRFRKVINNFSAFRILPFITHVYLSWAWPMRRSPYCLPTASEPL